MIPVSPDPLRPGRRWAAACLLGIALAAGAGPVRADPNLDEQRAIAEEALRAFRQMITLWREELYFELYESGWQTSKARLSTEEFARRMVELAWVPEGEPDPKFLKADFRHRTMVYVNARFLFQNKFNPTQRFSRDDSLLLLKEDGQWKVDLVQLIRSPYS
jgi:hypothetical protein